MFYGYDTGTGLIVDLVEGVRGSVSVAGTGKSVGTSPFGQGLKYVSGGLSTIFPIQPVINKAFLASLYSIACAWYITVLPSIAFTCPFGFNDTSGNNASAVIWDQAAGNDVQWILANTNPAVISVNTVNAYHTFLGTNTGAAAQNIYFDGKLANTTATTASFTTAVASACFNNASSAGSNTFNGTVGIVYYGAMWNRTISAAEARKIHDDPYCFLIYPEDDMFATLVGTAAAAPFVWSQTSDDQQFLPRAHLIREMIRHD